MIGVQTKTLEVDPSDPVFFDHPLDHVPGMLLIAGLYDHAVATADVTVSSATRARLTLDFTRFCELDSPTVLSCEQSEGPGWRVRAVQGDTEVCTGTIDFIANVVRAPRCAEPAPAELVHRARRENVFVGAVERELRAPVLDLGRDHVYVRANPNSRGIIEMIEAGRQFCILLEHSELGMSVDDAILWQKVTLDLPCQFDRSARLEFVARKSDRTGRRGLHDLDVIQTCAGLRHGWMSCETYVVTRDRYAAMRRHV